jgi:hypothetical protein
LKEGAFAGPVKIHTINGNSIKTYNTFEDPAQVTTRIAEVTAEGPCLPVTFEPHSVTALSCMLR